MHMIKRTIVPTMVLLSATLSTYAAAATYTITPLFPADPTFKSSLINNAGDLVGLVTDSANPSGESAFIVRDGAVTRIGTLPGTSTSRPYSTNSAGQITGIALSYTTGSDGRSYVNGSRAFLYSNGVFTDLGTAGNSSQGQGINNAGQVVGSMAADESATPHAFLYSNGTTIDLGSLGGIGGSSATGINNLGQITGNSHTVNGPLHAFLYTNGAMADLGALAVAPHDISYGIGINDLGQVIGASLTVRSDGSGFTDTHAFFYQQGAMIDMGTLGGTESHAYHINNAGVVVGSSATSNASASHAFIYRDGQMTDLNTLLDPSDPLAVSIELQSASSINDSGVILTGGVDKRTNEFRNYLLTPVPAVATVQSTAATPSTSAVLSDASTTSTMQLMENDTTSAGSGSIDPFLLLLLLLGCVARYALNSSSRIA